MQNSLKPSGDFFFHGILISNSQLAFKNGNLPELSINVQLAPRSKNFSFRDLRLTLRYKTDLRFWGNLQMFRDSLSVSSSWPLEMEPIGCSETSARYLHSAVRKIPKERTTLPLGYKNQSVDVV
jgi:hypothetical protein